MGYVSVLGSQKSNSGEDEVSDDGERDGQVESMIVGLPCDGTMLGVYGYTGVRGGVVRQLSAWSGR